MAAASPRDEGKSLLGMCCDSPRYTPMPVENNDVSALHRSANSGEVGQRKNKRKHTDWAQAGMDRTAEKLKREHSDWSDWHIRWKLIVLASNMGNGWYFLKWFIPGFVFATSFMIQNIFLHVATYFYVQWMLRLKGNLESHEPHTEVHTVEEAFSSSISAGSLHDVGALLLGSHDVPTKLLDGISLLVPFVWLVSVVYKLDLQLFSRACLCGSLLAITKGVFAVCTIVPDSTGWDGCKARLGDTGIKWFSDPEHMNFAKYGVLKSIKELLLVETLGARDILTGKTVRFRFCADMVYSGHTYFAALFATALYDFISKHWFERSLTKSRVQRRIYMVLIGTLLAAYVLLDCTLILLNRFHYTLDVVLALIIVYLFYTNAPVARASTWWANEVWIPRSRHRQFSLLSKSGLAGDTMVPPCCFWPPFCFMTGRFLVQKESGDLLDTSANMIVSYLRDCPDTYMKTLEAAVQHHEQRKTFPEEVLSTIREFIPKASVAAGSLDKLPREEEEESPGDEWIRFLDQLEMGYEKPLSVCICMTPTPEALHTHIVSSREISRGLQEVEL